MNRIEINERFANMWRTSRENAGKSQDYMAKALGVSKKTIQNWEAGTSCPSQAKGFEWFVVLDQHPMPYYLNLVYPDKDFEKSDSPNIDTALSLVIRDLPAEAKSKLLYMLTGAHGSSPLAMLELINAHLQSPLRDRINIAQSVKTNYELAQYEGRIIRPDLIQPDIEFLNQAIDYGKDAIRKNKETYTSFLNRGV